MQPEILSKVSLRLMVYVGGFFPSIKGISFSLGLKERHYYNGTAVLEGFLADADY